MRRASRVRRLAVGLLPLGLAAIAAACSSGVPGGDRPSDPGKAPGSQAADGAAVPVTVLARPAALSDLPAVELLSPAEANAGPAPTFEWRPVAGAAGYRLSVLGRRGLAWAWLGPETSVRYGAVPEGAAGPSLPGSAWWSVAALSADGRPIALSELRAVSPAADAGSSPDWLHPSPIVGGTESSDGKAGPTDGKAGPSDGEAAPSAPPAASADGGEGAPAGPEPSGGSATRAAAEHACDLLTGDEITAAVGGSWGEPELKPLNIGNSWCDWTSSHGTQLSLAVGPADHYDPDGWSADETLHDLGDTAYRVNHGWDRRIGFVHGDLSVMLVTSYTRIDPDGFLELAQLVDARLP